MRYIRFESQEALEGTSSRLGVFQIAFRVRDAHRTSVHDSNQISHHIEWLKTHLESPEELDQHANWRAICWFKDTADEPIKHIWAIKPYLEAYGHYIDLRTSFDPGTFVYQDKWQVAAIPRR